MTVESTSVVRAGAQLRSLPARSIAWLIRLYRRELRRGEPAYSVPKPPPLVCPLSLSALKVGSRQCPVALGAQRREPAAPGRAIAFGSFAAGYSEDAGRRAWTEAAANHSMNLCLMVRIAQRDMALSNHSGPDLA